jgi:hypothetical protein
MVLLNQASLASLNSVYAKSGDLYWNNGSGGTVQITTGTSVNVGSVGAIAGMIPSCSVTYIPGAYEYQFRDQNSVYATLVCNAVRLGANATIFGGTDNLQLPSTLPSISADSFVVASRSGSTSQLSYLLQTGAITRSMLAPVGEQVQTSSSSYFNSSSTPVNLSDSITITTSGRPVVISLMSGGIGACLSLTNTGSAGPVRGELYFDITGSTTTTVGYQWMEATVGASEIFSIPTTSMAHFWVIGAGTYNIRLKGSVAVGGGYSTSTLTASLVRIYAYEL